ncbi:hypothetical protein [uncultured Dokdonia sp.]|uniref:hypothetical protein n=1 Tax=Dokdonia sp. Asnod2-E02 TaxID=3160574 RepID=UPI00261C17DD|nr:hypothetical protein [uncultured Dokdonia sp.]
MKTIALYFVMLLAVSFYASALLLAYWLLWLIFGKIAAASILLILIGITVVRVQLKKRRS